MATIRLGDLAVRFGCSLRGDPDVVVTHVATLESAGPAALSFLANAKYKSHLAQTQASAVILDAASLSLCTTNALIAADPYGTYARIANVLHPLPAPLPSIHPTAVIAPSAAIDPSAEVGPYVVVGEASVIGPGVVLSAGVVLGREVVVGEGTRLMPRAVLLDGVRIGRRCIVNAGAVLGSEGFGFAPSKEGWVKVPQVGSVRVGDDVEIGANTTIDRGAIGDTVIGNDVKLDNQIQIAHNVQIGDHTAIAACTGISGSTTIGKHCLIAGQVGIAGHLTICDRVVITGKTMISASIREPGMYSGSLPADETRSFRRNAARFARLDEWTKKRMRQDAPDRKTPADDSSN